LRTRQGRRTRARTHTQHTSPGSTLPVGPPGHPNPLQHECRGAAFAAGETNPGATRKGVGGERARVDRSWGSVRRGVRGVRRRGRRLGVGRWAACPTPPRSRPAPAGCAGTDGAPQPRHPHRTRPGTAGIDGRRWCWGRRLSRDDLLKRLVRCVLAQVAADSALRGQTAARGRGFEGDGPARRVGRALGLACFHVRLLRQLADESEGHPGPRAARLVVGGRGRDGGGCASRGRSRGGGGGGGSRRCRPAQITEARVVFVAAALGILAAPPSVQVAQDGLPRPAVGASHCRLACGAIRVAC